MTTNPRALYTVKAGKHWPLGANVEQNGVNFALFSAHATDVFLCLFDENGKQITKISIVNRTEDIWHVFVAGLTVGQHYGYRVDGPYQPESGHRFNVHKLLIDPYARQLSSSIIMDKAHYGFDINHHDKDLIIDCQDNADKMPKCIVTPLLPGCQNTVSVKPQNTVIYELHVKGFSQLNDNIPTPIRGTFAAICSQENCDYLTDLGITSVEILPVHQFCNEPFLTQKSLTNYWGYNSINFFCPHVNYLSSNDIYEFRYMVEKLHQANIEVILDVAFNHTAEGDELGPTYSFKGIDNASYYRLQGQNKRYYVNESGCGNTLNLTHPAVLQMLTDSLRYWVDIMGVDGFRFDLAPLLAKEDDQFNCHSALFTVLKQDPILARVKLIAEPWDPSSTGYQLGKFPSNWLEWNDKFRDTSRRFWRGDDNMLAEFAKRLHGSSDIFETTKKQPQASINFITCHDGFTLTDLVSYQHKHNNNNKEDNQDGHNNNFSDNYGCEGITSNLAILRLRARQQRNLLTTLFIAQGVPMLLAGDELDNSQQGNNNAYCQDNPTSWLNWQMENNETLDFVKYLIKLRKTHSVLRSTRYRHGCALSTQTGLKDINWLNNRGEEMTLQDWQNPTLKCFAMLLANIETNQSSDDGLLIIFNAQSWDVNFRLPTFSGQWRIVLNTMTAHQPCTNKPLFNTQSVSISSHSCLVLSVHQQMTIKNNRENTALESVENKEYKYD